MVMRIVPATMALMDGCGAIPTVTHPSTSSVNTVSLFDFTKFLEEMFLKFTISKINQALNLENLDSRLPTLETPESHTCVLIKRNNTIPPMISSQTFEN